MHRRDCPAQMGTLPMSNQLYDLKRAGRQTRTGTFGKLLVSWVVRLSSTVHCLQLPSDASACCHHWLAGTATSCGTKPPRMELEGDTSHGWRSEDSSAGELIGAVHASVHEGCSAAEGSPSSRCGRLAFLQPCYISGESCHTGSCGAKTIRSDAHGAHQLSRCLWLY